MGVKIIPKPELLAITTRDNTIECLHYGWICVLNKDKKIIYQRGNIFDLAFLRSVAKPIQAIPLIESDINVSKKELAVICGSHSGSEKHIKVLSHFMKKHGINFSNLKCGTHIPSDQEENKKLVCSRKSPTLLHNNCSGKHLGMLAVCKKNNWDLKTYLSPKHPLQKAILKDVKDLSETNKISIAVDGCSAPTFALPVVNIAKMFSNFTLNEKYLKIISAMTTYPYFVGGTNQIDTEIMKASNGRLFSKVGGLGIIIVAYKGSSLVIKVADGSPNIRSKIALDLLLKLGWLKKSEIKNSILREIASGTVKNLRGKAVGRSMFIY